VGLERWLCELISLVSLFPGSWSIIGIFSLTCDPTIHPAMPFDLLEIPGAYFVPCCVSAFIAVVARRGNGLVLRGKTSWLDFTFRGIRHQVRLGKDINRTGARELGAVERSKILRGEAGIGGKERRDITFEKASEEFLQWGPGQQAARTVEFYGYCLKALEGSFAGKKLSEIHLIEKHKQKRLAEGFKVEVSRELTCLNALFNRCQERKKFEGENPVRSVKRIDELLNRVRFLSPEEE
jgi:hypothetical protein